MKWAMPVLTLSSRDCTHKLSIRSGVFRFKEPETRRMEKASKKGKERSLKAKVW